MVPLEGTAETAPAVGSTRTRRTRTDFIDDTTDTHSFCTAHSTCRERRGREGGDRGREERDTRAKPKEKWIDFESNDLFKLSVSVFDLVYRYARSFTSASFRLHLEGARGSKKNHCERFSLLCGLTLVRLLTLCVCVRCSKRGKRACVSRTRRTQLIDAPPAAALCGALHAPNQMGCTASTLPMSTPLSEEAAQPESDWQCRW
jgi:hypothetical protein